MKTRILKLDPGRIARPELEEIAMILTAGGVMAYPTETFYGLGAAGFSARAVARVFRLKKRNPGKPLSVMASGLDMVREISRSLPAAFRPLAEEFWPGPLTMVLAASHGLPDFLAGPGRSIAVRVPPVGWIRDLADAVSQPITATSANVSGAGEMDDPAEVTALFEGRVELIVDGGRTPGGAVSTIVDLTPAEPRVLREGAVSAARIRACLEASGWVRPT